MLGFRRSAANLLLAAALVVCLQPIYFLAMAHLDRVISHERTWEHISEAFSSSVPRVRSRQEAVHQQRRPLYRLLFPRGGDAAWH